MSCDYLRSVPIRRLPNPVEENPIWSILGSAISGVVAVALSLPFLLAFLVVLPACLSVRWLLLFIHCSRQGPRTVPGPESVRGSERRWLGTQWRSSVIHAVLVFEAKEGVNVNHFRRLLLKRVIPVYPRLTQRLISLPISAGMGNCWLTDSKFSIDNHVFSGPSFLANEKDLQEYVSKLVEDGLPEDKPPWQLQVFTSFGVNQDVIVILRVHQSIADGTVLMRLLCHSLADSEVIEIPERPRFGSVTFWLNVFRACIVGPLTLFFWLFLSPEDCNLFTHRSTWTGSVTVTWSASITLPKVIRIKQVTRSTVNCVLLSALAGALRRLLNGCGVRQPPNVKVVVPMDLRNQSSSSPLRTKLGNKNSSVTIPLPVAVEGCVPRLWATRKTLDSSKISADPVILYVATAALMSVGSASFARNIVNFLMDKASLQFASLAGPTTEIFLEGQTLKGIYPILPAQANLGISITTITYADQVFVSVIAERALGPAAELILEYLEDQIEILWKLLLNRRVPDDPHRPATFSKPIVSESPIKEIASRLNLVQKEVERLSEGKQNENDGKLCTLRAEFSDLVDELKRRQSLNETEDLDTLWKPRRRAFSSSTSKKLNNIPLNLLDSKTSSSELSKKSDSSESIETNSTNQIKHQILTTNFGLNSNQIRSFESPVKFHRKEIMTNAKNQNTKDTKDCIINIPEIHSDLSENISTYNSSMRNNLSLGNENLNTKNEDSTEFSPKKTPELVPKTRRRTNLKTKPKCNKPEKEKEEFKMLETHENGTSSLVVEDTEESESQKSEIEGINTAGQSASNTVTQICNVDQDNKGPNDLNCDLSYKNYLETVKTDENNLVQVPCQRYQIQIQEKFEDSDESDIVGGVLI